MKQFMKNIIKITCLLVPCAAIISCASVKLNEYPNITIDDQKKVETVKFHYPHSVPIETAKFCVKKNVENKDIPIKHSVGMWSMLTIFVLIPDKKDSIAGGDVILSEESDVLHAIGNVELESTVNGRNFLLFLLTIQDDSKGEMELLFSKPSMVFENTGFGKNMGLIPLGTHLQSTFEKNYGALEDIANNITDCLNRN
jgi:hypothetical protein